MKRRTNRNPGAIELSMQFKAALGVPDSPGGETPECRAVAHFRMELDLAPTADSDDAALALDLDHLSNRLRAVAASRSRRLPETLARDFAAVLLAEDRVHRAEVRLTVIPFSGTAPVVSVEYRRDQSRADPPFPPLRLRARALGMKIAGMFVKAFSQLFHAVFPARRWTVPSIDPPRAGQVSVDTPIPRIVWQTNFTARCTLPLWLNYLRNRRLSRAFEYRYVSTEEREAYLRSHAPKRVVDAYLRLEDGAAQADLWRLFVLWHVGGVYMDFDASLVRPLGEILAGRDEVRLWNRKRYTNYFMATTPGNPLYERLIETVVDNIERHGGGELPRVYYATGPGALEVVLDSLPPFEYMPHRACCVQGVFSNEHFQYMDRPGTKWTHKRTFVVPRLRHS